MASESADVVVIGGGAVGTSVAYHLTELGVPSVLLLERDALGSGSTSKSAGGVRTQFADELNIRIALRSLREFQAFEERFGMDIAFRQAGYLFLLDQEADVESFEAALALQASLGVPSRSLTPAAIEEMVPQLETSDLIAGTFCPLDGYATPEAVVAGYAAAARDRGACIRQGDPAERIEVRDGHIVAVETRSTRVATSAVVCAAGVWSRDVAALAGVELPVEGELRSVHYTPEADALPDPLPLTIDFSTGFYFHREGPGLVFGGREAALDELALAATKRLPLIADLPVHTSWAGYYEMSPDRNAIVGETAEPARFLYATGFSGHGFQQSPAVGEYLAELVVGQTPTLDLSAFSLERFARGERRREQFVI
ncbi:MAG: FAD-binding oxidoreductase [Actinomycetota bacterium]|nr:FAD-binding oxidoreductase [Actinomycetota bacterium]